jgi:hypothetical protein
MITDEQLIDEIKGLLNATTLTDAVRNLRELTSVKHLVWLDDKGQLHLAQGVSIGEWWQIGQAIQSYRTK